MSDIMFAKSAISAMLGPDCTGEVDWKGGPCNVDIEALGSTTPDDEQRASTEAEPARGREPGPKFMPLFGVPKTSSMS